MDDRVMNPRQILSWSELVLGGLAAVFFGWLFIDAPRREGDPHGYLALFQPRQTCLVVTSYTQLETVNNSPSNIYRTLSGTLSRMAVTILNDPGVRNYLAQSL